MAQQRDVELLRAKLLASIGELRRLVRESNKDPRQELADALQTLAGTDNNPRLSDPQLRDIVKRGLRTEIKRLEDVLATLEEADPIN